MLESLDLYKQVSNKPVQPHQKRSIIGGKSVKYFEFGIAADNLSRQQEYPRSGRILTDIYKVS
jgi:hypothetical protein